MAMCCFNAAQHHQQLFVGFHARNSNEGGREGFGSSGAAERGAHGWASHTSPRTAYGSLVCSLNFSRVHLTGKYLKSLEAQQGFCFDVKSAHIYWGRSFSVHNTLPCCRVALQVPAPASFTARRHSVWVSALQWIL